MQVSDEMVKVAVEAMEHGVCRSCRAPAVGEGGGILMCDCKPRIWDEPTTEELARSALAAALALSGWRTIDSAPKDGRRVLLYCDKIDPPVFQAQWLTWKDGPCAGAGEWIDIWNNDPIETNDGPIQPTLWLSEPAPPATAGKEG